MEHFYPRAVVFVWPHTEPLCSHSLGHSLGGLLPFEGQLVLEALHLLLHLRQVHLIHGSGVMWGFSTCAQTGGTELNHAR